MVKKAETLTALALICALLSGCFMLPAEEQALAPPLVEPEEIEYKTEPVTFGDIEDRRTVTAYFEPMVSYNLFFTRASGRIKSYNVRLGQEVMTGDILMELENESIEKRIRDQELVVKRLESRLREAQGGADDEYALKSALVDLEISQNALSDTKAERRKVQERYDNNPSSQIQEELDELDRRIRDQQLQVDKNELRVEQLEGGSNAYEVEQASLELESASNTLADLQAEYENTVLRSPIDGRVTWMKMINVGEQLGTYEQVMVISDPTQLVLEYNNSRASEFPIGIEVSITYDGNEYKGTVESNPSSNPLKPDGTRDSYARFSIKDFDYTSAASGESAQVSAVLDSRQNVIVINKNRVNNYLSRYYVNVLRDGLKEERDIELGLQTATQVEVVRGLSESDLVIIN